jgi:hypothetical protein
VTVFYYRKGDNVSGPMAGIDLREAAFVGAVVPATLISNNLAGPWFTASCAVGLFDKQGNPLPHPPETLQEMKAFRESKQIVADSQHAQGDQAVQSNYIDFISPCCSFSMKLPVAMEGQQGQCPRCESVVLITATQASAAAFPTPLSLTQPAPTQPAAAFPTPLSPTQPAAAFPTPLSLTQPAAAFPTPLSLTQPTPTQPAAAFPTPLSPTQPAATQPAATQPAATQPAVTQPAVTQPAVTQPAAAFPTPLSLTQPTPTQPAVTQPFPTQLVATPQNPSELAIDPALLMRATSDSASKEQFRNDSYLNQAQDSIQKNQRKQASQVESKGSIGVKIVAKCVIVLALTIGLVVFGSIVIGGFNNMKDWRGEFVEKNMERKASERSFGQ